DYYCHSTDSSGNHLF
nr:immunoglobulin light chain junction region [Macaca mulatta]MOX47086.1 immunoglobulin light chain junction region [Macaca mulatta]